MRLAALKRAFISTTAILALLLYAGLLHVFSFSTTAVVRTRANELCI